MTRGTRVLLTLLVVLFAIVGSYYVWQVPEAPTAERTDLMPMELAAVPAAPEARPLSAVVSHGGTPAASAAAVPATSAPAISSAAGERSLRPATGVVGWGSAVDLRAWFEGTAAAGSPQQAASDGDETTRSDEAVEGDGFEFEEALDDAFDAAPALPAVSPTRPGPIVPAVGVIEIGVPTPARAVPAPAATPRESSGPSATAGATHLVAEGETLSAIAAARLGDARRWREIAAANPSVDPDRLQVGQRLTLPGASGAAAPRGTAPAATAPAPPAPAPSVALREHVVAEGETLSSIAAQHLGSAAAWPRLFEANRDRLPGPDRVRVGQRLRIPAAQ
jgi:nucleoid-associated protein YgaU